MTPMNIQENFDDQIIVSRNVVSNSIRNYELERSQQRIMTGCLSNGFSTLFVVKPDCIPIIHREM